MLNTIYKGGMDDQIIQLFVQTFTDSEGAQEGKLIGTLVKNFIETTPDDELRIFTSQQKDELLGVVIFSKMHFDQSDTNTWILSPAAVKTTAQGSGVGQSLIHFSHDYLRQEGVAVTVTYGDIRFYSKVGYRHITEDILPPPFKLSYPHGWIAQPLNGREIKSVQGKSYCVDALRDAVYW